jgi:hypothetical protein
MWLLLIVAALAFYIWNSRRGNTRRNEAEDFQSFPESDEE